MKQYVEEIRKLPDGSPVKGRFAVRGKEPVRDYKSKEGKYFFFEVSDRTGSIGLKYWGGPDSKAALDLYNSLQPGDVVMLTGSVGMDRFDNVQVITVNEGTQGLAAGTALAVKERRPQARVIGVQAARVPGLAAALRVGQPVGVPAKHTLADGIRVPLVGAQTFPLLKQYLSEVVLVEEGDVAQAVLVLLETKKVLAEGAGAAAAAAFLGPLKGRDLGKKVVLVVSGGNMDIPLLERVLVRALLERGRLLTLKVVLSDRPGSLGRLAALLGELGANILHLFHDRMARDLPLDVTRVELQLETRDAAHGARVVAALVAAGYQVEERRG